MDSAGTLLYRRKGKKIEVLIVRPRGIAARYGWSIPKGLVDPGETLEEAARRETTEETGCVPGRLTSLGHIDYIKSPKRVHCFYGSGRGCKPQIISDEIDKAEFVELLEAKRKLHIDQRVFVDRLAECLRARKR